LLNPGYAVRFVTNRTRLVINGMKAMARISTAREFEFTS